MALGKVYFVYLPRFKRDMKPECEQLSVTECSRAAMTLGFLSRLNWRDCFLAITNPQAGGQ